MIDKKINTLINNAHPDYIRNFFHYLDNKNRKDLLLSISIQNLKVWNINTWENILTIQNSNDYKNGFYLGCFINENNNLNILAINKNFSQNFYFHFQFYKEFKIFDLNGINIKNILLRVEINYIDCYYDKKISKNYIILGHYNKIRSYDYENHKTYCIYNKSKSKFEDNNEYMNIIINDNEEIIKLIASNYELIEIWNFNSGTSINRININEKIYSMGLWNNKYLFVGGNGNIKLIDYEKGKIEENKVIKVSYNFPTIKYIEKIIHPLYGECLMSICGSLLKLYN